MPSILVNGSQLAADQEPFLDRLIAMVQERHVDWHLTVALDKSRAPSLRLAARVSSFYVPHARQLFWPRLSRGFDLFISPDASLPLLPMPCPMAHVVRDRPSLRSARLRRALSTARLTWFDSEQVRQRCEAWVGHALPTGVVRPSQGGDTTWNDRLRDLEAVVGRR